MSEKILSRTIKVEEENLAVAMGSGSLMVLATPAVVALMENAAAELAQIIKPKILPLVLSVFFTPLDVT